MKIKPKIAEVDTDDLIYKILELVDEHTEVETEYTYPYRHGDAAGPYSVLRTEGVWKPLQELLTEYLTGPFEKE